MAFPINTYCRCPELIFATSIGRTTRHSESGEKYYGCIKLSSIVDIDPVLSFFSTVPGNFAAKGYRFVSCLAFIGK